MSMDKVVASAAEAVADVRTAAAWPSVASASSGSPDPDRGPARAGRRPTSRWSRTTAASTAAGLGPAARGRPDPPRHRLLRRREQGVRPPVPGRRARGRADPAGHARRAAARRRRRHPRLLHPRRRRHAGRRGRPAVAVRARRLGRASPPRPRRCASSTAASTCSRRRILTDFALVRAAVGRPARQPRLRHSRPQLQPARGDGRADHHRGGRGARRARRDRPGRGAPARHLRAASWR